MQEYTLSLRESLQAGLRRNWQLGKNIPGLISARFFELQGGGLTPVRQVVNPFTAAVDFPFPQVFKGRDISIYAGRSTLQEFNSVFQLLPVTLSTPAGGAASAIREGGVWHFVDHDNTWALTNGQDFIFRLGAFDHVASVAWPSEIVKVERRINSVCSHRGRILTGGFLDESMWTSFWQGVLSDIQGEVEEPLDITHSQYSKRMVLWSSIGGGDFPFWLFFPEGLAYDWSPSRDRLEERIKRNELGWAVMPSEGAVLGLAPWGASVFVFSEDAVTRMFLAGSTYGFQPVVEVGAAGRGAFAVGKSYVVWIGSDGQLWTATPDGEAIALGYEEFFTEHLDEEWVVTYDPVYDRYFLSGESVAFTLSILQEGPKLFHSYQHVSSILNPRLRYGTFSTLESDDESGQLVTHEFNLGVPGIKTLTSVYLSCDGLADVAVDVRYSRTDDWIRSPFVPINLEGNAVVMAAGTDFRVVVRPETWESFYLDDLQVSYQISDRRAIRGPRSEA